MTGSPFVTVNPDARQIAVSENALEDIRWHPLQ
jgi:hypothetical protein